MQNVIWLLKRGLGWIGGMRERSRTIKGAMNRKKLEQKEERLTEEKTKLTEKKTKLTEEKTKFGDQKDEFDEDITNGEEDIGKARNETKSEIISRMERRIYRKHKNMEKKMTQRNI